MFGIIGVLSHGIARDVWLHVQLTSSTMFIARASRGISPTHTHTGEAGEEPKCTRSAHDNVADVASFTDVEPSNPAALLAAVVQQPVSIEVEANAQSFQFYKSGVIKKGSCGTYVDHAVLLVGYGTEHGTDFWLVKNSWSDTWGEKVRTTWQPRHTIALDMAHFHRSPVRNTHTK